MDATIWLGSAFAMFAIGLYCVSRRNMIRILLGIEIILNAGNFAFIYFATQNPALGVVDPLGQSIVFMSIVTGGAVVSVGLALIVNAYKQFKTTDAQELRRLKW
ncbi:NADH-quinone oxidoreductase subunit NuoK [Candidatus Bathyarchaeota archaeon]|nr:NADH-quinone oxidoreductase subunit NuoK [Candidatus Bathyarchaeota archaeon]